jgi:hypothetical protein
MADRISKIECLSEITASLAKDEGFRHLFIGYSGSGKTYANVELTDASEGAHKYTIVTDQKDKESAYTSSLHLTEIPSIVALDAVEPDDRNHIMAVIRGIQFAKSIEDEIDFDHTAKVVWEKALDDGGVLFVVDELADACQGERSWLRGNEEAARKSWMRRLYAQGRTLKVSIAACTQNLQEIPRSAITNSDSLGIFKLDRKDLAYAATGKGRFLSDFECELNESLEPYEFLFMRRGQETRICRF